MSDCKSVSIIIPCRNEERFIAKCLDSIIANEHPKDRLEMLVVDGMSEDGTRTIVDGYARRYGFIRLLDNPKKHFTGAANIGVNNANGDVVMIMGAHASYERNYISSCVKYLRDYNADNVGGVLIATALKNTIMSKAVALALCHPFGAGNAHYRIGSKEPRWVDTVFGGCYKKEVFERIGLFNEDLPRSADMDFNIRLKQAGGKILLVPEIVAYYYPKPSLGGFLVHTVDDGFWAVCPLKYGSRIYYWRHLVPLVFVSSLIGSGALAGFCSFFSWSFLVISGAYALANIGSSIHIAMKEKSFKYVLAVPLAFGARHIAYGLGSLYGLVKVLTAKQFWESIFSRRERSCVASRNAKGR